ncbi:hypothetical protein [Xenorhabdus budapestensis]|uniref:Uncharacterized protein n=1 Tax=Xenorhabdus budapestensis TaxID=290110 RepID=A0A2D0IT37_XENBU|nr:hypothetical protein [Xenorhabdus budapestensis]PHM25041.1 hypothetical protein Xbud_03114 [Xenorhabdus budapestensis]
MKTFFLGITIWILAVVACVVMGNYSGGALHLYLSDVSVSQVTWWSLYHSVHLPFQHPDFASAVWGGVLAAWIAFLPVFVAIIFLWLYFMPKTKSLYGNARFANNRELEPLHYKGDYH